MSRLSQDQNTIDQELPINQFEVCGHCSSRLHYLIITRMIASNYGHDAPRDNCTGFLYYSTPRLDFRPIGSLLPYTDDLLPEIYDGNSSS